MQVNFYATLRQAIGQKTEMIDLTGDQTLGTLLNRLIELHPELAHELQDTGGTLSGHIRIFINGEDVSYAENLAEIALENEDKVDIFPAIGGGSLVNSLLSASAEAQSGYLEFRCHFHQSRPHA